ncbi:hypothetical protein SAMN05421791_10163 [Facklamia miroungae]|uniref:Uncharacterized protein n=1 Tax=Facklamia miroungae TaxID=120956 RepID=A0A1G7NZ07_9LACT|nr:hypothetical protein SAMN05421791_10163 [Facklamia miroungae]
MLESKEVTEQRPVANNNKSNNQQQYTPNQQTKTQGSFSTNEQYNQPTQQQHSSQIQDFTHMSMEKTEINEDDLPF